MDFILFLIKWYIYGMIVLAGITYYTNKKYPNKGMNTTLEDFSGLVWLSWIAVFPFFIFAGSEFLNHSGFTEKLRKFYEPEIENE